MNLTTTCPVCTESELRDVFKLGNVPVLCNQLWSDAEAAASAPRGQVHLVRCDACAMVWNAEFVPERMIYAPGYENALHFSPKFRAFSEALATGLIDRHDLIGKNIIEIGCGDGHMLDLMVKHGAATATGFDPSMKGIESSFTLRNGVQIVPEYFRSEQLDRPFDAILCRHVLEHLEAPMSLLRDMRRAIGDRDAVVYFEVPNAGWMFDSVSMWDVIYEHVGYWTTPAVSTAFRRAGFEVVSAQAGFEDQFLMVEARPTEPRPDYTAPGSETVAAVSDTFSTLAHGALDKWRKKLAALDGQAVVWGAGSKGITFTNVLGEQGACIAALIDLNPRKHDLNAPGTALPVVSPDNLTAISPQLVLISNAAYEAEIMAQVRGMGLDPDFAVIAG